MSPSETRKIQRVGTSTLTISVPKRWAARCHLVKGDPVIIEDDGEILRITPPLVIDKATLDAGLAVVDQLLSELASEPTRA